MDSETTGSNGEIMTDNIELAELADQILDIADEDYDRLSSIIEELDEETRDDILVSDFLHAYQVFYFFFRTTPAEIVIDRLMLEPASSLEHGVFIDNYDIFGLWFTIKEKEGIIFVSDGDKVLNSFTGRSAYEDAVKYAKSCEW